MFAVSTGDIQQQLVVPCFETALATTLLCGTSVAAFVEGMCAMNIRGDMQHKQRLGADDVVRAQAIVDLAKSRDLHVSSDHLYEVLQVTQWQLLDRAQYPFLNHHHLMVFAVSDEDTLCTS